MAMKSLTRVCLDLILLFLILFVQYIHAKVKGNIDEIYQDYRHHFNFTSILLPSEPTPLHPYENYPHYPDYPRYDPNLYTLRIHTKPFKSLPPHIQSECNELRTKNKKDRKFYEEMHRFVHNNETRTFLYIYFHDEKSLQHAIQESICHDWMFPLPLELHRYCEGQAYKYVFPNFVYYWKAKEIKYLIPTTYKYFDNQQYYNHFDVKLSLQNYFHYLKILHSQKYDFLPLFRGRSLNWKADSIGSHGKQFGDTWDSLLDALGYHDSTLNEKALLNPAFYRSMYMATLPVLLELMHFMIRATNVIETNETVMRNIEADAQYQGRMGREQLEAAFHADHYKLYPFIMERLPIFYVYYRNFAICDIRVKACEFANATLGAEGVWFS